MQFTTSTLLAVFAATVAAYDAKHRSFAVNHFYGKGNLVTGRMDPIVNPGVASNHVHTIQGGNNFKLTMSDTDALDSNCTSSRIKNDKSNYWTPSLYFVDPKTGSIEAVELFYMNVYYFFEATTDKITAFKPGHRMVVGSPGLRTPPATGGRAVLDLADGVPQPIQWTCPRSNSNTPLYPVNSDGLHGVGIQDPNNGGSGVGFSDKNCDGYASPLRAEVHFPSCWNPAAGLTDYKNNMQWPTNGNCPTGWVHTPHLFYEVYWNTPKFASRWTQGQGTQPFVLSNGDPTGYSLHGDFLAGWDEATLQQIIDNCDAGDSGMDKCPGLIGGINDPSTSCNINSAINEVVSGVVPALPGNNPIGQWGVDVVPKAGTGASSVAAAVPVASTNAPAGGNTKAATVSAPAATNTKAASVAVPAPSSTKAANIPGAGTGNTKVVTVPAATSTLVASTLITSYKTTTTSITKTTSVGASSPSASSSISLPANWVYLGCYSDSLSNRALSGVTHANVGSSVTSSNCAAYCASQNPGWALAGTEYSGQCYCGNSLVGSTKIADSNCDMKCAGDKTQTCGGSLALSVYGKKGAKRSSHERVHFHAHMIKDSE